ncbi:MAG: type 1 glutamine amidotransferase [Dehalococcoidia bacterium]|nr:type 1 glutamine amidotransferase [Dehalococcoidia bacterium]
MQRNAVVIRHSPVETLGSNFTSVLTERGFELKEVNLFDHAPAYDRFAAPPLDAAKVVIALGGPMSVNDKLPALEVEQEYIREAVASEVPVFGVCLGAQLMAAALGGRVEPTGGFQFGLRKIEVTAEGSADPVFGKIRVPLVPTLHGDHFILPPGAVPMAGGHMLCRDGSYLKINMAYRYGSCYGFQFEPQLTLEELVVWDREMYDCYGLMGDAFDPARESERNLREFTGFDPLYQTQMRAMFEAFLDQASGP